MRRNPRGDVYANRGDLAIFDPDARVLFALARLGLDAEIAERIDHRAFEELDVATQVAAHRCKVEHGVAHQLAGAVIRRLPTTRNLNDRNASLLQHCRMWYLLGHIGTRAERDDRLVFEQHQRVRNRLLRACPGEVLHHRERLWIGRQTGQVDQIGRTGHRRAHAPYASSSHVCRFVRI